MGGSPTTLAELPLIVQSSSATRRRARLLLLPEVATSIATVTEVDLEGLRRKDAAVLIAAAVTRDDKPPSRLLMRVYILRRWRVRSSLRRLEERGLIEPGWAVRTFRLRPMTAAPTAEGRKVARAAAVTFELEGFTGPG